MASSPLQKRAELRSQSLEGLSPTEHEVPKPGTNPRNPRPEFRKEPQRLYGLPAMAVRASSEYPQRMITSAGCYVVLCSGLGGWGFGWAGYFVSVVLVDL